MMVTSRVTRSKVRLRGPLPWKRIWLNDDGDLLVDRSTDVPPLARDSFVRI